MSEAQDLVDGSLYPSYTEIINSIIKDIKNKLKTKSSTIYNNLKRTEDVVDIIHKPVVEMLVFSIEKNVGANTRTLSRKMYIRNNFARVYHNTTSNRYSLTSYAIEYTDIAIAGVEIQHSGIHGKKIQMSLSEQQDVVWSRIQSGDMVLIRTYLEEDEDNIKYSLEDFVLGEDVNFLEALYDIEFSGIITHKMKDVGGTEQFRFEAVDIINILRELNISITNRVITSGVGKTEMIQSDLVNLFTESLLTRFIQEIDRISTFNPLGLQDSKFFEIDVSRVASVLSKTNMKNGMKSVFFTKNRDTGQGKILVYSFMITPVMAVNFIIDYILQLIGLKQFMSVELDTDRIAKYFTQESSFINEQNKEVPFMLYNLYIKDPTNNNSFDLKQITSVEDVKENILFSTFSGLHDLSFLSEMEIALSLSNYAYFPYGDEKLVNSTIAFLSDYCIGENNGLILSDGGTNGSISFAQKTQEYKFNNFFDVINGNKVSIRINKFRIEGASKDVTDAIPLTMLLYYAFSLYNFTPVYNNVFKKAFKQRDIAQFDSYDFMYSLAQSTWLMSGFLNQRDKLGTNHFKFIILPMVSPVLYSEVSTFINRDKKIVQDWHDGKKIRVSDLLEYEFDQLELNRKILFITDDEQSQHIRGMGTSESQHEKIEYIRLNEGKSISKDDNNTITIDMFTTQTFNPYNSKKELYGFMAGFLRRFSYDYSSITDYHKNHFPIYPIMYRDDANQWTVLDFDDDLTLPSGSVLLQASKTAINSYANSDSNYVFDKSYVLPNELYADFNELGNVGNGGYLPLAYYVPYDYKDGRLVDIVPFVINRFTSPALDRILSDFQLNITLSDGESNEYEGSVDMFVGGTRNYVDLRRMKSSLSFMMYNFLLPQQLRDEIKIKFNPMDTTTDNLTRYNDDDRNREYTLDEVFAYLENLIDKIKSLNRDSDRLALFYNLIPDYNAMYNLFDEYFNTEGMFYNEDDEFIGDDELAWIYTTIYGIMKSPYTIDLLTGVNALEFSQLSNNIQEKMGKQVEITAVIDKVTFAPNLINLSIIQKGLKEIVKILFSLQVFVQDILRNNFYNGSLYMPNRGRKSNKGTIHVGDLVFLIDDRVRFNLVNDLGLRYDAEKTRFDFNAIKQTVDFVRTLQGVRNEYNEEVVNPSAFSGAVDPAIDSIYFKTADGRREKPYGWFVWKTVTYLGDASGGGEGTSGYTHKIYLARDGVNWFHNYEDSDFLSNLASQLNDRGYNIIIPEVIRI